MKMSTIALFNVCMTNFRGERSHTVAHEVLARGVQARPRNVEADLRVPCNELRRWSIQRTESAPLESLQGHTQATHRSVPGHKFFGGQEAFWPHPRAEEDGIGYDPRQLCQAGFPLDHFCWESPVRSSGTPRQCWKSWEMLLGPKWVDNNAVAIAAVHWQVMGGCEGCQQGICKQTGPKTKQLSLCYFHLQWREDTRRWEKLTLEKLKTVKKHLELMSTAGIYRRLDSPFS